MSAILRLFIDDKPTNLLKVQTGKSGQYFGTTKAGKFGVNGVNVVNAVCPNGHEHKFSIGFEAATAIVIPLAKYDSADGKFGGTVPMELLGDKREGTVVVTELPDGDRRIKAQVVRPRGSSATPKSAADVFAN